MGSILNFALCDDNQMDIDKAAKLIKEWASWRQEAVHVTSFTSPYGLLDAVSRGDNFNIFVLDILMPEMTGISLGEHLNQILTDPLLIFLTNSEDYYPDAFRLYAFQYICKPPRKDVLFPVLDKAAARCEKNKSDMFLLKTADGIARIPYQAIVYVELRAHICHFHLIDGQHLESLYLRTSFDSFIKPLMQQDQFVKTHTSFVVSLEFTSKLTVNALLLSTGATIPVARSFAAGVRQRYFDYGLREED